MAVFVPEFIRNLTPYRAGKPISEVAREGALSRIVKLASNENPLGPSPKALSAIAESTADLHRYPDPSGHDLVEALSARIKRGRDEIICGSGADAVLAYIINAFSREKEWLVTSAQSFIGFSVNAQKLGRNVVQTEMVDYRYDLEAIFKAVRRETRLVYLANANNPTGTYFTKREFEAFMQRLPVEIPVVLDEAYAVYTAEFPDCPNGLEYSYPNLLVLRTFSKSHGLAGLRIGYAVGASALIQEVAKVKFPFEPSSLAQRAATAAVADDEFVARTVDLNRRTRELFEKGFERLKIRYLPTAANFFLLLFDTEEEANRLNQFCLARGLILRSTAAFGIPNGIRINTGTIEETEFALDILKSARASQGV